MIRDITLGQYYPGDSFIHKLDPRFKIIATLVYIVALFIMVNFTSYIFTIGYMAAVIIASRVPLSFILRGMKPIVIILAFTFIINLFMIKGGDVLWSLGFLSITVGGVKSAVFLATRLIMLIIVSSMLTFTTKPIMLTDGIESLLKPFKRIGVPAHELAMMMSIALRFIPTLLEET
ncbi:MAG: energy-coupling factor transporter transmembrane component T, partial [Bacillota bacterium]|nr:energy-coupling factor transporter transmembrane component T [Bacillota bacterium]